MSNNLKVVPFDRNAAYMHHRAMKNRREQNIVDALELMRHAVERSPENREYRLDLAELYCEMGCHEQSNRLLLDMLAEGDAPAECYYGLALNRLGMNDTDGARRALALYQKMAPNGSHVADVRRLAGELEIYNAMNRPLSRKLYRAARVSATACECMRENDFERAKRLFERSLQLKPGQRESRALYAMTLKMLNMDAEAVREARQACGGFMPSVRALCVAAQVLNMSGLEAEGRALVRKAIEERPEGLEMRMLLYTLGEMGMDAEAAECARQALQETPYDRGLLHILAVASQKSGQNIARAKRCYLRILRIDPEDSVAGYYLDAAERNSLDAGVLHYAYQVPEEECRHRMEYIAHNLVSDVDEIQRRWSQDSTFRNLLKWAATADDGQFQRAAMTAMAAIPDEDAEGTLRELLSRNDMPLELKLHASMLLRLRSADMRRMLPPDVDEVDGLLPDDDMILRDMPVGQRQLVRFASEVLEERSGFSSTAALALTWQAYRGLRGMRCDPLMRTEAAAAALLYCYSTLHGKKVGIARLAKEFGCTQRQLIYFARRMADVLNRGGRTTDETH